MIMPDKTTGLNEYSVMLNFSLLVTTELKHKLKYPNSAKIHFHSPELFSWAKRAPEEYLCYGKLYCRPVWSGIQFGKHKNAHISSWCWTSITMWRNRSAKYLSPNKGHGDWKKQEIQESINEDEFIWLNFPELVTRFCISKWFQVQW